MYLLTYDITDAKRLQKVAKLCEKYLIRVQKSVFEGDLTESQLHALRYDLNEIIDDDVDAVAIYLVPSTVVKKKIMMGIKPIDPYVLI